MELSTIVYSTLAIVLGLVVLILIVSYIGFRIRQKEETIQNATLFDYQRLRTDISAPAQRNWH